MASLFKFLKIKAFLVTLFVVLSSQFALCRDGESSRDSGGANGGGGFQYTNSKKFLRTVTVELIEEIKALPDFLFRNLKFSKLDMIRIIRNVRHWDKIENSRINPDGDVEGLMFDYGVASDVGPYIAALKPFFESYQMLPMLEIESIKRNKRQLPEFYVLNVKEVKRRLVHEFAHLLGKNEQQAAEFAEDFFKAKNSHGTVYCEIKKSRVITPNLPAEAWVQNLNINMFIDIATGVTYSVDEYNRDSQGAIDKIFYPLKEREDQLEKLRSFFERNPVNPEGCWTPTYQIIGEKKTIHVPNNPTINYSRPECQEAVDGHMKSVPQIKFFGDNAVSSANNRITKQEIVTIDANNMKIFFGFGQLGLPDGEGIIDLRTGHLTVLATGKHYPNPSPDETFIPFEIEQHYHCKTSFKEL